MSATITEPIYHTELIDGREIQKPLPKKLHAIIQGYLTALFVRLLSKQFQTLPALNIWCGPDRLVPDLVIADRHARYEDGDLIDPAAFAIEIVSPGQTLGELLGKADRIVRAGTPACWVILPQRRKAWMLSADDLIEAKDVLEARLPDGNLIQVQTAEMWAELDEDERA